MTLRSSSLFLPDSDPLIAHGSDTGSALVLDFVLADASALAALNATVQSLHARLVPELFKPAGADTYDEQMMRRLVAQPDTIMLVAFVDGVAAGYAYAEVRRRSETPCARASSEVYLHHMSVDDAFQRMGVGSALLEGVGAAGHERGIQRLATEAWTTNQAAIAFLGAWAGAVHPEAGAWRLGRRPIGRSSQCHPSRRRRALLFAERIAEARANI